MSVFVAQQLFSVRSVRFYLGLGIKKRECFNHAATDPRPKTPGTLTAPPKQNTHAHRPERSTRPHSHTHSDPKQKLSRAAPRARVNGAGEAERVAQLL